MWCSRHYLSHRSLCHAASVRAQLATLLLKMDIDPELSCAPNKEPFLRCLATGLFLHAARLVTDTASSLPTPPQSMMHTHGFGHGRGGNWRDDVSSQPHKKTKFTHTGGNGNGGGGKYGFNSASDAETQAPYRTIKGGQPVHIHPSSVLFSGSGGRKLPKCVVFTEMLITGKQYMRGVTAIEPAWLVELLPGMFRDPSSDTSPTSRGANVVTSGTQVK